MAGPSAQTTQAPGGADPPPAPVATGAGRLAETKGASESLKAHSTASETHSGDTSESKCGSEIPNPSEASDLSETRYTCETSGLSETRGKLRETSCGVPTAAEVLPTSSSSARGSLTMPAKERKRDDSKKLLKGLQIFKRSKSKQSLTSTPSMTAASPTAETAPTPGDQTPVFAPADEAGRRSSTPTASLGPASETSSEPAPRGISLSRITGDVAESAPAGGEAESLGGSATPTSDAELNGFDGINGELAEKLRKVEELERKIKKVKEDVDRATERKRRQEELDSKIIEALILEKMQGMGLLKGQQVTDPSGEPEITLPDSPPNGLTTTDSKMGPLAKFASLSQASDALGGNSQMTSNTTNTATRMAKRSQVLSSRATASSASELTASLGGQISSALNSAQSEQQSFGRKVTQAQVGMTNGLSADVARLANSSSSASKAAGTQAGAASAGVLEAQAQAVKALQTKNSVPSLASTTDARQLAESFDSLKKLSMDRMPDSLSMENLDDRDLLNINLGGGGDGAGRDPNVKVFEQKQSYSTSNKKLVTNDFSTEEATANREEMTRLEEGDNSYRENKASSDMRARLELNGVTAEKGLSTRQEERHLKTGDVTHDESRSAAVAGAKLSTDAFSTEKVTMAEDQQRQTKTSVGVVNKEQHSHAATHSKVTISKQQGVTTPTSPAVALAVEELGRLQRTTNPLDVSRAVNRCSQQVSQLLRGLDHQQRPQRASMLDQMDIMMRSAWTVPTYGHEIGSSLCDVIRDNGGLDVLISSCNTGSKEMDLKSARVLGQCLTTTNRHYVVERGLDNVVQTACRTCSDNSDEQESRVGTGLLENLFKHSEDTCSDVVRMGGLDALLTQCKTKDVETLRHCASALANLSLYGGPDNQQTMMERKVPSWLFPLAFHNDANIKYYACLAIATMVANKQIEAAVLRSGTLELVEPFVTSHDPDELSKSAMTGLTGLTGQSKNWLRRLVPVLFSKREEARKLAAFHFCMEAGIKVRQGCPEVFEEIGAIKPLKQVASSPNAVASKYAAQALHLIGQEVPHKLSQQVPLWSVRDVCEWVKQIDFSSFAEAFETSRVDGDLLLRISEDMLKDDIGITNGILRTRFMRELNCLKKMADYASCDPSGLNAFLQAISPELSVYTYLMLTSGVDKDYLRYLNNEQLLYECNVTNSIHRLQIQQAIKNESAPPEPEDDLSKTLDCFISYRRSNGSQLASLLKVHLELRGFSVFIDVERLEAGKFDNNLLNSIRQAKNFILVLTPSALDRCIEDVDQKDWIHKEVYAALQSKCNIIPVIDNFQWPEAEELPEDMRAICTFNGISWIHDYQDACVDKLERFIRGEVERPDGRYVGQVAGPATPSTRPLAHAFQRTQSSESARDV
ncbi:NAD(+) hydrolase sarm1-like isoform X3 [Pollicipes pollicipes]|uniref:NAD(+) hydrolase sarm1-like isoform X3 n=1 Tax=Pollicipes pollicipes TaxID=41117 RepID=UPI001885376F|nr:NAD(+) hydrolase sarm1-like isoform X3 [Pollicipes pollicipes]